MLIGAVNSTGTETLGTVSVVEVHRNAHLFLRGSCLDGQYIGRTETRGVPSGKVRGLPTGRCESRPVCVRLQGFRNSYTPQTAKKSAVCQRV